MKFLYSVRIGVGIVGLATSLALSANANALSVQEVGVNPLSPTITCTGAGGPDQVYAGVNQVVVDGTPMNGFCVAPFQLSLTSSSSYSYVPLTGVQRGYSASTLNITAIERLWANYYSSATTSASTAAGLQIAIWELAGGTGFTLDSSDDFGAAAMLGVVQSANYDGPAADVVALTGRGQGYLVESSLSSPVPDNGNTLLLFSLALCALAVFGAKPVRVLVPALARSRARCAYRGSSRR